MHDLRESPYEPLETGPSRSHHRPILLCLTGVLSWAISAGLCVAAIMLRPPTVVVPVIALTCVFCAVFGTWELPVAFATLRGRSRAGRDRRAIVSLRRSLARLPEVQHPLDG